MDKFDEKTLSFIIIDNFSGEGEESTLFEFSSGKTISKYDVFLILIYRMNGI